MFVLNFKEKVTVGHCTRRLQSPIAPMNSNVRSPHTATG